MVRILILVLCMVNCTSVWSGNVLQYIGGINREDAAARFPYTTYWKDNIEIEGTDVAANKRRLDSIGWDSRRIIYNLYGPMRLKVESLTAQTPQYVLQKINRGQQFMAYADVEAKDPAMYRAIATLWLQHACNIVSDTITENPKLAYNKEYAYLIRRLQESEFAPTLPAESSMEKVITTIAENEWGHLAERFMDRAGFIVKAGMFCIVILLAIGFFTTLQYVFLSIKRRI